MMIDEMAQGAHNHHGTKWIECVYPGCKGNWKTGDKLFKNVRGIKTHLACNPECKASLIKEAIKKFY